MYYKAKIKDLPAEVSSRAYQCYCNEGREISKMPRNRFLDQPLSSLPDLFYFGDTCEGANYWWGVSKTEVKPKKRERT